MYELNGFFLIFTKKLYGLYGWSLKLYGFSVFLARKTLFFSILTAQKAYFPNVFIREYVSEIQKNFAVGVFGTAGTIKLFFFSQ